MFGIIWLFIVWELDISEVVDLPKSDSHLFVYLLCYVLCHDAKHPICYRTTTVFRTDTSWGAHEFVRREQSVRKETSLLQEDKLVRKQTSSPGRRQTHRTEEGEEMLRMISTAI